MTMDEHDERELRARFRAWREEEADARPAFLATLAAARHRQVRRLPRLGVRRAWWLAGLGIAAAVFLVLVARRRPRPPTVDLAAVRWAAPTDFLLHLPGQRLLRGLPRIGDVDRLVTPSLVDSDWRFP
jgi:hypothetical protein